MLTSLTGLCCVASLAALTVGGLAAGEGPNAKLQELVRARKELAHRQRRIICNNDGNEPVYYCKKVSREEFLSKRTAPLAGSQVDAIFYCTWSSGFGFFTHNTKVGEVFNTKEKPFDKNLTQEFLDAGLDPLQMIVDWCRENAVEAFWSMRMNDVHDGGYPPMVPEWKHEHPEFLFGSLVHKPTGLGDGRAWSGVDYGRAEVRDRAFRFIWEVCENYDVDGIEMDFFRHPLFFKSRAWGKEVSEEELGEMTAFIRRVRRMTEAVGIKRGKPILVAMRVPDSAGYCRSIGLDVERWLKEDLVDIMTVSGYFQLQPWEDSVALGHKYDVPVYCCLSESRMKGDAGRMRRTYEAYRARATNVWNSGADGVYTFNYFNPKSPIFREMGDSETLKRLDKTYFVNIRGAWGANAYSKGGEQFVTLPTFSPERPITLQPGKREAVPFPVGENLLWGKADGIVPVVALQLQFRKLKSAEDVEVTLNGSALSDAALEDGWLAFAVKPELVKQGENEVAVTLKGGAEAGPVWADLMLKVDYPE